MKKSLDVLFNIFWVLLVGLFSAISNAVMGISLILTIIGIPFGLQYIKFVPLAFAPAGKRVVTKFSKHPVMNVLWLILGGLEIYIVYKLLVIILSVTIIGIPIALQLDKIADFNFAPFGAEIIKDTEFSKDCESSYDLQLLLRRIIADPDKVVGQDETGAEITARDYMSKRKEEYIKQETAVSSKISGTAIIVFLAVVFGVIYGYFKLMTIISPGASYSPTENPLLFTITIIVVGVPPLVTLFIGMKISERSMVRVFNSFFVELYQHYANSTNQISELKYNKIIFKKRIAFFDAIEKKQD